MQRILYRRKHSERITWLFFMAAIERAMGAEDARTTRAKNWRFMRQWATR